MHSLLALLALLSSAAGLTLTSPPPSRSSVIRSQPPLLKQSATDKSPRRLSSLERIRAMPELPRAQGVSVRWVGLQGIADLFSLFLLSKIVGIPPLELLGSPLVFWTILGPSGFMLGLVMTRINKREDDTSYRGKIDWDTDPIVRLMGGKEDVATLRVVIRELTTF